jgi:hypothetical protein
MKTHSADYAKANLPYALSYELSHGKPTDKNTFGRLRES